MDEEDEILGNSQPQSETARTSTTNQGLPTSTITQIDKSNCIKILVATDNHIGYAESDPIRGRDAINTFREILQLAIEHDVDMLLLAGDLFHENRPSRESLYSTMASLREYCLNSRPIQIELVGDAGIGISHGFNFPPVNYEDENINVGLPVFSIHGNHDDPQGIGPEGALCALDILSASGLINYFGRQELPGNAQTDEEALEEGLHIQPVLLQKGRTRLAMYGIGNIRDERFHYEMRSNRIRMSRPAEFREEWFNLMLVHQNRVAHGHKNSVPENGFGDDLDLLIWGHEHDCLIQPAEVPGKSYFISQPGSSVATSLAKGESLKKHVAILEIQDRDFSMTPIPLTTVRPFVFHDIVLSEEEEELIMLNNNSNSKFDSKSNVIKFLKKTVEELIVQANNEWEEGHTEEDPSIPKMLPLIRLRVEYSRPDGNGVYEVGNPQRFGQDFLGKVANPKDVVQFYKKRKIANRKSKNEIDLPDEDLLNGESEKVGSSQVEKIQVSTLVHQYLEAQNLGVLAENGMQRAVTMFVEKDDRDAIKEFYTKALKATQAHVNETNEENDRNSNQRQEDGSEDEELLEQLTRAKEIYVEEWEKNESNGNVKGKTRRRNRYDDESEDDSDFGRMSLSRGGENDRLAENSESGSSSPAPPPPPKKGGGRTAKSVTSRAKSKSKKTVDRDESNEESQDSEVQQTSRQKHKTGSSTAAKKTAASKNTNTNTGAGTKKSGAGTTTASRRTTARSNTNNNSGGSGTQTRLNFSQRSSATRSQSNNSVPVRGGRSNSNINKKKSNNVVEIEDENDTFDED